MAALDRAIDGDGIEVFGDVEVTWLAFRVTTVGPSVTPLDLTAQDHLLRLGWLSLGAEWIDEFDAPLNYWRAPIWLDFHQTFWTPSPSSYLGAYSQTLRCSRVRWHLTPGSAGWLYINT
jgi:hypothetical protein